MARLVEQEMMTSPRALGTTAAMAAMAAAAAASSAWALPDDMLTHTPSLISASAASAGSPCETPAADMPQLGVRGVSAGCLDWPSVGSAGWGSGYTVPEEDWSAALAADLLLPFSDAQIVAAGGPSSGGGGFGTRFSPQEAAQGFSASTSCTRAGTAAGE